MPCEIDVHLYEPEMIEVMWQAASDTPFRSNPRAPIADPTRATSVNRVAADPVARIYRMVQFAHG